MRLFYFVFGGIAPIAIQVLQVINEETLAWADFLKQYFNYIPPYNLTFGYISISNIRILEILKVKELKSLDWECAGESLWLLFVSGGVSLFILIMTEVGFIKKIQSALQF